MGQKINDRLDQGSVGQIENGLSVFLTDGGLSGSDRIIDREQHDVIDMLDRKYPAMTFKMSKTTGADQFRDAEYRVIYMTRPRAAVGPIGAGLPADPRPDFFSPGSDVFVLGVLTNGMANAPKLSNWRSLSHTGLSIGS